MTTAKGIVAACLLAAAVMSCARPRTADLVLVNGRVYTLSWPDPDAEGRPAATRRWLERIVKDGPPAGGAAKKR